MNRLIVTSLLTLQIASFFGGNNHNVNPTANTTFKSSIQSSQIDSVLKNAFSNCKPTLKIAGSSNNTVNLNINKLAGTDGFDVYRAPSQDGIYKYIGSTNSCNFTDKNANTDQLNSYKVRAYKMINGQKVIGKTSNIKCTTANKKIVTTAPTKTAVVPKAPATTTTKTTTPQTSTTAQTPSKTTSPATTPTKPATTPTTPAASTQYDSSFASQVLKLVNQERAKGGLQALTMSQVLLPPANKRAQEIKVQFSHTRPNGTQWSTVLQEYNVSVQTAGENLAYGYNTPEAVVTGWMNSPGHRANIMNGNFNKIGVGVYKDSNGTVYCTQLFSN